MHSSVYKMFVRVQYDIYCEGQDLPISDHAITVLLYTFCGNKYFMPKVFFYINIVYYIIIHITLSSVTFLITLSDWVQNQI
jgi:hypothetical protein